MSTIGLDYQRGSYPDEVVGMVRDARDDGPRSEPLPEILIPHSQNPYVVVNVIARTTLDPVAAAQTARAYALRRSSQAAEGVSQSNPNEIDS
jgi:hypothetical protein